MKNEQEYLGKPEGKKPGPVMRCDKAYQEIRQILKPGLLSFFFEESRQLLLQVSLLAQIPLHRTLFRRLLTCWRALGGANGGGSDRLKSESGG